ncbi:MAG: glutamate synthase-related protein [Spirochaetota bacterium]|nr:glutamate synthase-related protein [Spirochaetota bacterium]
MSGKKLPENLIVQPEGFPIGAHKLVRKTSIAHDEPKRLGMHNVGARYRVKVTSEEEEPGRGCIHCGTCVLECTHNLERPDLPFGVFWMEEIPVDAVGNPVAPSGDEEIILVDKVLHINQDECCNCKRCVKECPRGAIQVYEERDYHSIGCELTNHTVINSALKRSRGVSMVGSAHHGLNKSKIQHDWLIDAAEILSPQRDNRHEYAGNLRETYLGKRKARFKVSSPIFDVNQSYGSNSHEAFMARMMGSIKLQRPFFTGEGFVHPDFEPAFKHCIVQFGSGGYGPWVELDKFAGFNMKYGQDAKKGKGGRLNGPKNDLEIALLRCVEALRTLTAPNPQHLQYSIEELPMRVETLRALLGDQKLIGADAYGTAWNYPEIVVALAKAGFDYITIKGGDGSTGAAHIVDLQNRGLNTVYLTHIADLALRKEGLRESVSIIAEGGILDSFSAFLVLMAGADFVGMGMRHLHPLGCTLCKRCHTGQCAWGITSRRYGERIDPEEGANQIYNMNMSWIHDMEGLAAGLGMSTLADVVGSRRFRYHGNDPLLYETFGKEEWKKQLSGVNFQRETHSVFKTEDDILAENKGLIDDCLSQISENTIEIDVGVDRLGSKLLNVIMKEASRRGAEKFILQNVAGQRFIGTGVKAKEIHIHGLSGNNSFAFTRDVRITTYPVISGNTKIQGNVQVGVANTANPVELNVGGEVNDLFASYAVSGKFRVAKGGGVRNLLLFKAGLPDVWKEIDPSKYHNWSTNQVFDELLLRYQKRKARIEKMGWENYLQTFAPLLDSRKPPVGIFGLSRDKGMGDYFMEYAQGGFGILLNIFDLETAIGFYACSGMTAGACFIRGKVHQNQLGVGVVKEDSVKSDSDREFLATEITEFIETFSKIDIDPVYNEQLKAFAQRFSRDQDKLLDEFCKIVPVQ